MRTPKDESEASPGINRKWLDLFDYTRKNAPRCYHLGMNWAGFVLVGGRSERMGQDKALLPWKSGSLVESIAVTVRNAAGSVRLVGPSDRYSHLPFRLLNDLRPGLGPLSGIEAALGSQAGEYNLIVACDMPILTRIHLRNLLEQASKSQADCVVTSDAENRLHPLCAVYRSTCLPAVTRALDEQRLKLTDLADELRAKIVSVPYVIRNVNTPEAWKELAEAIC